MLPIKKYVTQYDLVTDLNEDKSLTNIINIVVLCPFVNESNYNKTFKSSAKYGAESIIFVSQAAFDL